MKGLLGAFAALFAMALLAGALLVSLRGVASPAQAPAAQPLAAQPTPTPCGPVPFQPDAPPVPYKLPPDAPKLPPELLTPWPVLPPECADQLRPGPTPTPTPPGWTFLPGPLQITPSPVPTPRPGDPFSGPVKTAVVVDPRPDYVDPRGSRLIDDADLIFVGFLGKALPSRWGTRDGRGPGIWREFEELTRRNPVYIYTPVTLKVDRFLKNPQATYEVELTMPGGQVGDVELGMPDLRRLQSGGKFLVFTAPIPEDFLTRVGLAEVPALARRSTLALFEIGGDGMIEIRGPGVQPYAITLEEAAADIMRRVR